MGVSSYTIPPTEAILVISWLHGQCQLLHNTHHRGYVKLYCDCLDITSVHPLYARTWQTDYRHTHCSGTWQRSSKERCWTVLRNTSWPRYTMSESLLSLSHMIITWSCSVFSPPSCDDEMKDLLLQRRIRMLHWLEPHHLDIPLKLTLPAVQELIDQGRQGGLDNVVVRVNIVSHLKLLLPVHNTAVVLFIHDHVTDHLINIQSYRYKCI